MTAESVDYDGVHLDKTALLEADGTYSIKLEAYATGQTITVETEELVPTDSVDLEYGSNQAFDNVANLTKEFIKIPRSL